MLWCGRLADTQANVHEDPRTMAEARCRRSCSCGILIDNMTRLTWLCFVSFYEHLHSFTGFYATESVTFMFCVSTASWTRPGSAFVFLQWCFIIKRSVLYFCNKILLLSGTVRLACWTTCKLYWYVEFVTHTIYSHISWWFLPNFDIKSVGGGRLICGSG